MMVSVLVAATVILHAVRRVTHKLLANDNYLFPIICAH